MARLLAFGFTVRGTVQWTETSHVLFIVDVVFVRAALPSGYRPCRLLAFGGFR